MVILLFLLPIAYTRIFEESGGRIAGIFGLESWVVSTDLIGLWTSQPLLLWMISRAIEDVAGCKVVRYVTGLLAVALAGITGVTVAD